MNAQSVEHTKVRRETWNDKHFHTTARNSKGQFIATKRWNKETTVKKFSEKYSPPERTFIVDSPKKYDMTSSRNQSLIFNKVKEKYHKYPIKENTFRFRHIYDANTGLKLV